MEEQKQTPSPMTPAGEDTSEAAPAQAETSAVEDVAAQIAALETKAREHYDLFLRATAECENIRRRAREDVAKAHKFAIETFADHLLPVMDSLQAALSDGSGDIDKLREGVELTARQLSNAFEKGKILELNPVGEKFDPYRHQAISMVSSEQEANTVVAVLQRGYLIADRVLRPALVTVSAPNCSERNPEGADPLQNPTASGPLADKVGGPDGPDGPDGPGGPDDDFKGLAC